MGKDENAQLDTMVYQISHRIMDIQKALNISVEDMANLLEVSPEHYKKLLMGRYKLSIDKFIKILITFRVREKYFLYGDLSNGMFYDDGSSRSSEDYSWIMLKGITPEQILERYDALIDEMEVLRSFIIE